MDTQIRKQSELYFKALYNIQYTLKEKYSLNEHKKIMERISTFQYEILLLQFNVLALGQLNLLRLIQLIYYGWAQLNLIVSAQLVCNVLDQLI